MNSMDVASTPEPLLETAKTKLIALWFIVVSLISVLVVIITAMLSMNLVFHNVLPDDVMFISLFLYGSMILVFSYLCVLAYKISSSVHRLEIQAYQSARLLFLVNIVGSGISIGVSIIFRVGLPGMLSALISIAVNGLLLFILTSEKRLFTREGKKSLWNMSVLAVIFLVCISLAGIYIQTLTRQRTEAAVKELDKKIADELKQQNAEPTVKQWTKYRNNTFHFQMDIPEGWAVKEYPPDLQFGQESTLIAFSGDKPLPNERYIGLENAHTYVVAFPTTATRDYSLFQRRISQIGQDNFSAGTLGGISGVDNGIDISVEQGGYVYEFFMKLQVDEKYNYTPSPLSRRMKESFRFTQ